MRRVYAVRRHARRAGEPPRLFPRRRRNRL